MAFFFGLSDISSRYKRVLQNGEKNMEVPRKNPVIDMAHGARSRVQRLKAWRGSARFQASAPSYMKRDQKIKNNYN
jgi:hypothetical protein